MHLKRTFNKWDTIRYAIVLILVLFYFCIPSRLFDVPYSTVITDRDHHLLGAHIAADGQWRFPVADSVPKRVAVCLTTFEDEHFYYHPGVNPAAFARAVYQNVTAGRVVSGGSTLSMQTIRLARPASRNIWTKLVEMVLAVRLEFKHSKKEILNLYASHAPFGANVVGIEAASWRYYSRPASDLSWGEAATLAVLPNAPGLIHPGRNRDLLKAKRDRLLKKLLKSGAIDTIDYELSVDEPVVNNPTPLPRLASHVLAQVMKNNPGTIRQTTLNYRLQEQAGEVVERHARVNRLNKVNNAAAIIIENSSSKVIAYIGNTRGVIGIPDQGNDVDVVQSKRSTGSILKPLLYAASLHDGLIWPHQLLRDIPTYYTDFSPQNYNHNYEGAVKANEALSKSLNVPFVRLLDDYSADRFLQWLRRTGFTTFNKSADHYGLTLILGGAETSLWELAGAYSSMARTLSTYTGNSSRYLVDDLSMPHLYISDTLARSQTFQSSPQWLSASSVWFTFEALSEVHRPEEETGWETFASTQHIAWKTGTSFGFRDGWAVGVTPQYTVAVWVGNASGEGRPGITGGSTAAPILFDLFRLLPSTNWFDTPFDDFKKAIVCRQSGLPAGVNCEPVDTTFVPATEASPKPCPFHHLIHLDKNRQYRVTSNCYSPVEMVTCKWFLLPPLTENYYKNKAPDYETLPPMMEGCSDETLNPMEFIYPTQNVAVYIPKNIQGGQEQLVVKIAHRHPSSRVFWYVDDDYIGETTQFHQKGMQLSAGNHVITVTDEGGNRLVRRVKCLNREE